MTVTIYGIGKFGAIKTPNRVLPILNTLFLWAIFWQIQSMLMTARFTLTVEALRAPYIPSVLIAFQAVTAAAILLEAAKAWAEPWRFAVAGTVLLSCFGAAAVFVASHACVEFYDIPSVLPKDTTASLISLAVLCACALAYRGKLNRYALGASPVIAVNLSSISLCIFGYDSILPALSAITLLALPAFRKDKYVKLASFVIYLISFDGIFIDHTESVLCYIGPFLLMLAPVLNYALICVNQDGFWPELEQLGGVIFPALVFRKMMIELDGCGMLWVGALAALSLAHRYLVPNKQPSVRAFEQALAKVLSAAITVWICLRCYIGGMFMPELADKVIVTILLISYSVLTVSKTIHKSSVVRTVLCVIFSHYNSAFVTLMWNSRNANIFISYFGLLLSAVFIGLGFWKKRKPLRLAGLASMIGYVLKIALVDISRTGDTGKQILVLLAGGIVCFGVSFAYNKLDKLYGDVKTQEQGSEEDRP